MMRALLTWSHPGSRRGLAIARRVANVLPARCRSSDPPVLGLEHDLVTSGRAPASAPPPLRWERRCPASSHAATNEYLEIRERHAAALLFPDRAKREDRVERVVSVHP